MDELDLLNTLERDTCGAVPDQPWLILTVVAAVSLVLITIAAVIVAILSLAARRPGGPPTRAGRAQRADQLRPGAAGPAVTAATEPAAEVAGTRVALLKRLREALRRWGPPQAAAEQ